MSDSKPQKISIGFDGGPVLAARVAPAALKDLRERLDRSSDAGDGTAWYDLPVEDGLVALDLRRVVYVMADTEAHRVGFGG